MIQVLIFLDRTIRALVVGALALASIMLFFMATVGAADVAMLNFFGQSIPIVSELSADALAVVVFLAIAFAQQQKQHVSVDLITNLLPPAVQRFLGFMAHLVTLGFFIVLTWRTFVIAQESWELKQTAMALFPYPVYPFKISVFVGTVLATLESVRQIIWYSSGRTEIGDQPSGTAI